MRRELPLDRIAKLTGAVSVTVVESVQSLWSGYGEIVRVRLSYPDNFRNVIVKFISPPNDREHKYGWSDDVSHQRKLHSYRNEIRWYRAVSHQCGSTCRVPGLIAVDENDSEQEWLLALEDLDAAGFPIRRQSITQRQLESCLSWLARLHARFLVDSRDAAVANSSLTAQANGLWPIGTYWHLDTRPAEWEAMENGPLKNAAHKIDDVLNSARFQTLVHGDAKLANFCFSNSDQVAAVDFQYVGGGCGVKDLAYFVSSCFHDDECERREQEILTSYFSYLQAALAERPFRFTVFKDLELEWRRLYPIAWADFYRFLTGWSPGHWKMHRYSERITQAVLNEFA